MSDWTDGYIADLGYTYGYYRELNPLRTKLPLIHSGFAVPRFDTACELGFGQGVSINVHAAASSTHWFGTDFNPEQASFARDLAAGSGASVRLFDEAFADFANRADLPDFDFIGLHGIWTWISNENRSVLVDFVRRKLKIGGVLYISYNTLPGWASFVPMRHLMKEHARVSSSETNGMLSRITSALSFTDRLLSINPAYARANPTTAVKLKAVKEDNQQYVAHEYFNQHWAPVHFATMAEWLAPAKVTFACTATYDEMFDPMNLNEEQRAFLNGISDSGFRESVRDFIINQHFRRDYWIKGPRRISPLEQAEAARTERVVLVTPRSDVKLKVKRMFGEATLNEATYAPILDVLADHKVKTIGHIEQAVRASGVTLSGLVEALIILSGEGNLGTAQGGSTIARVQRHSDGLNRRIIAKARSGSEIRYLADPVTGGGLPVGRIQQLFLHAIRLGRKQPSEWVEIAHQVLMLQGQKIIKSGQILQSTEEQQKELGAQANLFAEKQLPILKALQVA